MVAELRKGMKILTLKITDFNQAYVLLHSTHNTIKLIVLKLIVVETYEGMNHNSMSNIKVRRVF